MTLTVHLTPGQRDRWPAPIVVDDEPCEMCDGDGWTVEGPNYHDPYGDKIECLDCNGTGRVLPLEWREATGVRPTCDGVGHQGPATGARQSDYGRACVGGRWVVTITADCPRCQNDPICDHGGELQHGSHGWGCEQCGLSGTSGGRIWHRGGTHCVYGKVTLGRFTIQALPVGDNLTAEMFVTVIDGEALLVAANRLVGTVTLDPLPHSGQFVLIGTEVI